jgi:hypothetical protein
MADIKIIVDSSDVATATNRVDQLGSSGTTAQEGINKATRGMNQFGAVASNGGKKLNTFNMQIQQGGYQLQDFVVQLQSGTSFFTAFGQQGSQFAGVFGPQGAVIGAVIAIGSAVGGMAYKMLTAGEDVKTLQEKVEDLEAATSDYADALSGLTLPVDAFGNVIDQVAGKVSALSQAMLEVKQIKFEESLKAVTNLLPAFESSPLGRGMTGMEAKNVFDLFPEIKRTQSAGPATVTAAKFGTLIGKAMEAEGLEEQAAAFEAIRQSVIELAGPFETMDKKQREFYESVIAAQNQIQQVIEANEAANAKIDDEKQKRLDKLNKARFAAIMARYNAGKKLDEDRRKREEKERVAQAALDAAGDKAILTARAKAEIDLFKANAAYERKQKELDAAGDRAILENQAKAELELSRANDAYEKMADAERQKRLDELNDKVEEMAERLSIPFAAALSLIRQAKEEATVGLDAFGGPGSFKYGGSQTFTPDKTKKTQKSDLQILREQLTLESALVGQTEARQRVIQALGVEFSKKNPQTVASLEKQIQLTKELIQEEQQRKDLIGFVADSMGDSFMSMVEGTKSVKDAFREMASDIVRELYRVLVVQQMVNSAKTFLGGFFADGGAFSGGSQIQAYADGGVVGSPTYFGMSGGKTGLMGEAGPEAIMPLSRGANGKLGVQAEGVGGVTINQNINISTGVQQTVRSEIKSMMPQIAEQSKAAVLDAKRRGGSYGSKF